MAHPAWFWLGRSAQHSVERNYVALDSRNHILGASEPTWQDFLREIEDFVKHQAPV